MRILVTGGAGYVGSVVDAHLVEAGHVVVVLDDLSTGHRDAVPPGAAFACGDIADAGVTGPLLAGGIETVMHFAGVLTGGGVIAATREVLPEQRGRHLRATSDTVRDSTAAA